MVETAVDGIATDGAVLEIACGSGLWTRRLAPKAARYVAVDSSPRMLELNRSRYGAPNVEYVLADAFEWTTRERFDLVFFGFFVSHIPPEMWEKWWRCVASWLLPNGMAYIVDDTAGPDRPYSGDVVEDGPPHAHRRRLSGGREYTIVKVFYSPEKLTHRLEEVGWKVAVGSSGEHFICGSARPR
ncbi:MAG: class I SAM-dependent methyltransferase [Actinomycetota bacterium]